MYLNYSMSQQTANVIACCILIVGIAGCFLLDMYIGRCRGPCGRLSIKTAHERECRAGHNYYSCAPPDQVRQHVNCSPWQDDLGGNSILKPPINDR